MTCSVCLTETDEDDEILNNIHNNKDSNEKDLPGATASMTTDAVSVLA